MENIFFVNFDQLKKNKQMTLQLNQYFIWTYNKSLVTINLNKARNVF